MNSPVQEYEEAPPVILPILMRHAEDAAFYWSQLDASTEASLDCARVEHFDRQLRCHLGGLHTAGTPGGRVAWAALMRWKKPGEAFVCTWLALQQSEPGPLEEILAFLDGRADQLLRAVVSAFAYQPATMVEPVLAQMLAAADSPLRHVVALRVLALRGGRGERAGKLPLDGFFKSGSQYVRASACRAAERADLAALSAALDDPDLAVRAEAAIALTALDGGPDAVRALESCVLAQALHHNSATGWARKQSARRLARWVSALAPAEGINVDGLLDALPSHAALTLVLHRGDAGRLAFVADRMQEAPVAGFALFVWQSITGIDPERAGLLLAPATGHEPCPDPCAVKNIMTSCTDLASMPLPVLLGRPLDPERALEIVAGGAQALRHVAAAFLKRHALAHPVSIRAPFPAQQQAINGLRRALAPPHEAAA